MHFPFAGHRPHEAAPLDTFGEQAQPVTIGPQYFHHFATAAPEDEDMPGERVIFQRVLHLRGQTVEATTHIGDASDDPDSGTGRQRYHRGSPFNSPSNTRSRAGVIVPCSFIVPPGSATSQQGTSAGDGSVRGAGATGGGTILTGSSSTGRLSLRFSFPCLYWWRQLNSRLSLIPCSRARRATLVSGCIDSSTR